MSAGERRPGPAKGSKCARRYPRTCRLCGEDFMAAMPVQRYCSPACRMEAHRLSAVLAGDGGQGFESVAHRLAAVHTSSSAAGRTLDAANRIRAQRDQREDQEPIVANRWGPAE